MTGTAVHAGHAARLCRRNIVRAAPGLRTGTTGWLAAATAAVLALPLGATVRRRGATIAAATVVVVAAAAASAVTTGGTGTAVGRARRLASFRVVRVSRPQDQVQAGLDRELCGKKRKSVTLFFNYFNTVLCFNSSLNWILDGNFFQQFLPSS